jgi:nitric oxide dioxygenase
MLSDQTIAIVKATAPAVAPQAEAITRCFYKRMFAENPETQQYFNQAHQHSGGQQRALAGAICAYAANIDNLAALGPAVELIAQKHCSLGIHADQYPIVGKHLLAAIKDILGDAASPEVLTAWSDAYGFLADIFIGRERGIYQEQLAQPGGWNGYRRFVVARKVRECETIASFYLRPEDARPLPGFKAGQYITVRINDAVATAPRNYSLSDRPGQNYFRISVKREGPLAATSPAGIVSNFLHDQVNEGDVVELGPPCGEFTFAADAARQRPLALLAGGSGVTPLMSMLECAVHYRVTAPIHFVQFARNSQVHAFDQATRRLAEEHANLRRHVRYDAPLPGDVESRRCDSVGLVDDGFLRGLLPHEADFYFCGPKPFMTSIHRGLKAWGVLDDQIHFEFFGPRQELVA